MTKDTNTPAAGEIPPPPADAGPSGVRLWTSVVSEFELAEHELALLIEAVRTVDLLDELDQRVKAEGAIVESPQGRKANPAAVEARQQRIALARILAALRMPSGDTEDETRPQRRVGVRGVYGITGAVS